MTTSESTTITTSESTTLDSPRPSRPPQPPQPPQAQSTPTPTSHNESTAPSQHHTSSPPSSTTHSFHLTTLQSEPSPTSGSLSSNATLFSSSSASPESKIIHLSIKPQVLFISIGAFFIVFFLSICYVFKSRRTKTSSKYAGLVQALEVGEGEGEGYRKAWGEDGEHRYHYTKYQEVQGPARKEGWFRRLLPSFKCFASSKANLAKPQEFLLSRDRDELDSTRQDARGRDARFDHHHQPQQRQGAGVQVPPGMVLGSNMSRRVSAGNGKTHRSHGSDYFTSHAQNYSTSYGQEYFAMHVQAQTHAQAQSAPPHERYPAYAPAYERSNTPSSTHRPPSESMRQALSSHESMLHGSHESMLHGSHESMLHGSHDSSILYASSESMAYDSLQSSRYMPSDPDSHVHYRQSPERGTMIYHPPASSSAGATHPESRSATTHHPHSSRAQHSHPIHPPSMLSVPALPNRPRQSSIKSENSFSAVYCA